MLDVMVGSTILERYCLDSTTGSTHVRAKFIDVTKSFYSTQSISSKSDFNLFHYFQFYDHILDPDTQEYFMDQHFNDF